MRNFIPRDFNSSPSTLEATSIAFIEPNFCPRYVSIYATNSPSFHPSLPSNVCRFAVNNANFASPANFHPLQSAKSWTSLKNPISLFSLFSLSTVIRKKGDREILQVTCWKGYFFSRSFSTPLSRDYRRYFLVTVSSPVPVKSCEITGHSFFANFPYCAKGDGRILARGRGLFPRWLLSRIIVASRGQWMKLGSSLCCLLFCYLLHVVCRAPSPLSGDKLSRIV